MESQCSQCAGLDSELTTSGGPVHGQVVSLGQEEGGHHAMGPRRRFRLVSCQTVPRKTETSLDFVGVTAFN